MVNEEDEDDEKNEDKDGYEVSELKKLWTNEKNKLSNEITGLKWKNKLLEMMLKQMQSTPRKSNQDKTGWMGDEMMFVKDINDFCREMLYPKEKFLRKNCHEYLPNDRRSLYSVCMKHLSIPEGSNPSEIWSRVIIPSIRDKYQLKF